MEKINVYNYNNPRLVLLDYLSNKQKADVKFSVRKWAQAMGMGSHSLLVMLLQGKRPLRIKHSEFLCKGLSLDSGQAAYFKALIQYSNSRSIEEKKYFSNILLDLHPGNSFTSKEVDNFSIIADWEHMAILALTKLRGVVITEEEICKRFKSKITSTKVRSAITRLKALKLISVGETGGFIATHNRVTTSDDIANEGAREHHRQVAKLAQDIIEELPIEAREFQSFTMAISKEKLPLAKEMIKEFRKKFSKAVSGEGDEVYQTNIHFFQLTECPKSNFEDDGVEGCKNKRRESC